MREIYAQDFADKEQRLREVKEHTQYPKSHDDEVIKWRFKPKCVEFLHCVHSLHPVYLRQQEQTKERAMELESRTLKRVELFELGSGKESVLPPSSKMGFLGNKILSHFKLWKNHTS